MKTKLKSDQELVAEFSKPNANWIELVRAIRGEALEAAVEIVVADCQACGGKGYIETTGSGHACGGDEKACQTMCPVPVQEQEQCEYCGRPAQALLTKIEELKK